MDKTVIFSLFVFLFSFFLYAQVDISGTVINQANFPVDSLEVSLRDLGEKTITDKNGKFSFQLTGVVTGHKNQAMRPEFKGKQFIIPVHAGTKPVSIEIYNLKGAKLTTVINKVLPQGKHTVPFTDAQRLSPSVLVAVIRCGSEMIKLRIIKAANNSFLVREFSQGISDYSEVLVRAGLMALDSIDFIRRLVIEGQQKELREFTIPVSKWREKFKVTLDLIPYEAVEWGKTQEGRSHGTVGKEFGKPGSGIYPYEFETYYNGAWCSEFYSYCMRIGGCPLGNDGGSATRPNWMVTSWSGLIRWFERNAEYIEKSEITAQNYRPNPGDFIQMAEHTTMVRYVAENDDVYCLGGNEGNKVKLRNRGNYKTFSSLNGYGRRSGITGNSFESIGF